MLHLQPLCLQFSPGKGREGRRRETLQKFPIPLVPMPHWPELGHMATYSCKGGWEIQLLFVMAILAQLKTRRESIWGGRMSRRCPGKILLPIFFYRWENLEDGHSTNVAALISDELGFAKSYLVTFYFSHAPCINKILVINFSMLLRREKLYKNGACRIVLSYSHITAYFIKQKL